MNETTTTHAHGQAHAHAPEVAATAVTRTSTRASRLLESSWEPARWLTVTDTARQAALRAAYAAGPWDDARAAVLANAPRTVEALIALRAALAHAFRHARPTLVHIDVDQKRSVAWVVLGLPAAADATRWRTELAPWWEERTAMLPHNERSRLAVALTREGVGDDPLGEAREYRQQQAAAARQAALRAAYDTGDGDSPLNAIAAQNPREVAALLELRAALADAFPHARPTLVYVDADPYGGEVYAVLDLPDAADAARWRAELAPWWQERTGEFPQDGWAMLSVALTRDGVGQLLPTLLREVAFSCAFALPPSPLPMP